MTGFRDRRDAGRQLAAALARFAAAEPVVLALPRGGVPVAYEVAEALDAPLDIVLVRKIGAPGHKELGMGAVAEGREPVVVMDERLVRVVAPPPGYVAAETAREIAELTRRRERYAPARVAVPVEGRLVVLVDDGLATGGTARAALRALRQRGAGRLVLAVPVGAPENLEDLRPEADEIECLLTPAWMGAVGQYYADFSATPDEEVVALLREAARNRASRQSGG